MDWHDFLYFEASLKRVGFNESDLRMSGSPIEKRALGITAVSGLSTVLGVALQLITVPICLQFWGESAYGAWLALFSAFILIRSLDAGYVGYVGNKLNYLYHQDKIALRRHMASALVGIGVIGLIQMVLVAALLLTGHFASLVGLSSNSEPLAAVALVGMLLSWTATGSYLGIVHRFMIPVGMMKQAVWWAMAFQMSQFAAIMIAAVLRLDILQTSLLFALFQAFNYLASAIYMKNKLPDYYPWWQAARADVGIRDLIKSLPLSISTMVQQGTSNGVVLVIAGMGGAATVPLFTTVRTLTNLWNNVTMSLANPLLPDVVRFHATREPFKLAAVNEAYWVIVGGLVNFGVVLSYPLVFPLYGLWTRHSFTLDPILFGLLLASVVIANVGGLITLHLNGINSLGLGLAVALVRFGTAIGGGYLAYPSMGIVGFGLGILFGEALAVAINCWGFFKNEIINKGAKIQAQTFCSIVLSVSFVLIFLLIAAFNLAEFWITWLMSLIGVFFSTIIGWKNLNNTVKLRLKLGFHYIKESARIKFSSN